MSSPSRPGGRSIAELFSSMTDVGKTSVLWPRGCRKPEACAKNRACSYIRCPHTDRDIEADIDLAAKTAPLLPDAVTKTYVDGLRDAAEMLNVSQGAMLLAAGEMSASELRTAKAILAWRRRAILTRIADVSGEACS